MSQKILKMSLGDIVKRGNYLYHLYYWLYGLYYDWQFCGRSMSDTVSTEQRGAYPAQCISYPYLQEFVKNVKFDREDVFVDVGCAWGRLIGYLMRKTEIRRLIGIELNEEVGAFAQSAFCKKQNVNIIIGDAVQQVPEEGTVFYLFNPFDGDILDAFLGRLEAMIKHPVRLLYLHPMHKEIFEKHPRWQLKRTIYLEPKRLGALELCEYQFVPEKMTATVKNEK